MRKFLDPPKKYVQSINANIEWKNMQNHYWYTPVILLYDKNLTSRKSRNLTKVNFYYCLNSKKLTCQSAIKRTSEDLKQLLILAETEKDETNQ